VNKNEPGVRRMGYGQSRRSMGSPPYVNMDPGESRGDHLESGWDVGVASVADPLTQRSGAIFPSDDSFSFPGRRVLAQGRPLMGCGTPR